MVFHDVKYKISIFLFGGILPGAFWPCIPNGSGVPLGLLPSFYSGTSHHYQLKCRSGESCFLNSMFSSFWCISYFDREYIYSFLRQVQELKMSEIFLLLKCPCWIHSLKSEFNILTQYRVFLFIFFYFSVCLKQLIPNILYILLFLHCPSFLSVKVESSLYLCYLQIYKFANNKFLQIYKLRYFLVIVAWHFPIMVSPSLFL